MSDDISINSESIKKVAAVLGLFGAGMLYDIKDHCKRSCTAEHCNNCALRKYTEEKNENI